MIAPRITSIRYSCTPARKVPKAGDRRFLKGRGVWQIRQQEKIRGAYVVSNSRPVWEWVDVGSDRDRAWQANLRGMREYFEEGCLCILGGDLVIRPDESNQDAFDRYMAECKCSRHPEHGVTNKTTTGNA